MGLLAGGGYAERIVTNHRLAVHVPQSLSWVQAAACPEAFITAHDGLAQADAKTGESVLVHAAGSGVGVAAIQIARVMGATPIIGTAGSAAKLERAASLGLDVGVNYKDQDFVAECMSATGGKGVDVVLDFIGAAYLERNVAALAAKGRMVIIGLLGGLTGELNLGALLAKRLDIRGTLLRARSLEEKAMVTRAFEKSIVPHLASGRIAPVIDKTFALAEAVEAHRYMESNANFGKIVLAVSA
jgi:NADPH:quinone reductase-like Zn-dependent oxidoreductase